MQSASFSSWLRLDPELLHALISGSPVVRLRKKQPIFYQGDTPTTVYVVKEGRVCITTYSPVGVEQQLYIAEQGALFGERSCLLKETHMATAISIVDSSVYAIPAATFFAQLEQDFQLSQAVLQIVCKKNSLLVGRLLSQSSSDSLQRIAQTLLDMAQSYEVETESGYEIPIRFSHQDVANLLHISRVTVTKAFQAMAQEGIIKRKQGHIRITDHTKLIHLAHGDFFP